MLISLGRTRLLIALLFLSVFILILPANAARIYDGNNSDGFKLSEEQAGSTLGTAEVDVYVLRCSVVSVSSDGILGNGTSANQDISEDGRFAAFSSGASNLVSGDTNGVYDIFVRDLTTGVTERVSVASDGSQGNGNSYDPIVSADGRYVAFASAATNLVNSDTNGLTDIFVHDRITGETVIASLGSSGQQASYYPPYAMSMSPDGRFVVFSSNQDGLVAGDTGGIRDVFLRDLENNTTVRVSQTSAGVGGNRDSDTPSVSAYGEYVVFQTLSDNLGLAGTGIIRYRRSDGALELVSVSYNGQPAQNADNKPSISADGRFVAFQSMSQMYVQGVDYYSDLDIYVRDMQSGVNYYASPRLTETQYSTECVNPNISYDGRYVTFVSASGDLVFNDGNQYYDVFLRDLQAGETVRVNIGVGGAEADSYSYCTPAVSADGTRVLFSSAATNLAANDTNGAEDVFLADTHVKNNPPAAESAGFSTDEDVALSDVLTGSDADGDPITFAIVTNGARGTVAITNASTGAFTYTPALNESGSDSFTFKVNDGYSDSTAAAVTITINPVNAPPTASDSSLSVVEDTTAYGTLSATDPEGDAITFRILTAPQKGTASLLNDATGEYRYIPNADANGADSFTFRAYNDEGTSTATVTVSIAPVSDPPVAQNGTLVCSPDTPASSVLVFSDADGDACTVSVSTPPSHGTVVIDNPATGEYTYTPSNGYTGADSFEFVANDGLFDSNPAAISVSVLGSAGAIEAISVSSDEVMGNAASWESAVSSADGRYVAFSSEATNLTADDTNGQQDVFVRDRETGTTEIVSIATDGTQGNYASYAPSISADGRYVTFISSATNLAAGDPNGSAADVFLRDRQTGTTTLVSVAGMVYQGMGVFPTPAAISADGSCVVFQGYYEYVMYDPNSDVFIRDMQTGSVTRLGCTVDGWEDNFLRAWPSISADGRFVSLTTPLQMVPEDTDWVNDVYVYDRQTAAWQRASVTTNGGAADGMSFRSSLSSDGRYVTFASRASNLTDDDGMESLCDAFRRDLQTGETIRLSGSTVGGIGGSVNEASQPVISADGRYVAFASSAADIVSGDANGRTDIFRRDVESAETEIVSVPVAGSILDGDSLFPSMTADGMVISFTSRATNAALYDTNGTYDIFARDLTPPAVNQPPTLDPIGDKSGSENQTLAFTITGRDPDGGQLTLDVSILPDGATCEFTTDETGEGTGTFTWTPTFDQAGIYPIMFTLVKGELRIGETITITIANTNRDPIAADDTVETDEDQSVVVPILANDSDPDGEAVMLVQYNQPGHGSTALNEDDTVTYTPEPDYYGLDSFTYIVMDSSGGSATGTVNITVASVNDLPSAVDDTAETDEDTPVVIELLANDTDDDGDTLTVSAISDPEHGTAVISSDSTITYTPDENFNGTDILTYTVSDGTAADVAFVTVIVEPVNDTPAAEDDAVRTDEDTEVIVNVLTNDSDVDGDALSVLMASTPAHGTAVLNLDTSITYEPDENYNGPDSFTYTITDGTETATATVNVTVDPVNDSPVAVDDTAECDEDGSCNIYVTENDSDPDGDALKVASTSYPSHGNTRIDRTGRIVQYIPLPDYNGPDSFTYTVRDSYGGEAVATVYVTVTGINDRPVLDPVGTKMVNEGDLLTFTVTASDAESDALTYSTVDAPAGASIDPVSGVFSWTPDYDQSAKYTMTLVVSDGELTDSETIAIEVYNVNRPPLAADDSVATNEDAPVTANLLANDSDPDGDPLRIKGITQPSNGSAVLNLDGTVTYTPNGDYSGPDSFTYTMSDSEETATATVNITVNPVNDPPVLNPVGNKTVDEHGLLLFTVTASDVEGDALIYSSPDLPTGAAIDPATGEFSWRPEYDQAGVYPVTIIASDGSLTDSEVVSITVNNVNQVPIIDYIGKFNASEGQELTFSVTGRDPDGDPVTVTHGTLPEGATFTYTDDGSGGIIGTFTWQIGYDQSGSYALIFYMSDGELTASKQAQVMVSDVNRAPEIDPLPDQTIAEGGTLDFETYARDLDGDPITLTIIERPLNNLKYGFSFEPNGDMKIKFQLRPTYDQAGVYTLVFQVSDGTLTTTKSVQITVENVNRAPLAVDDSALVDEDSSVVAAVLDNDSDPDNDTLSVTGITQPVNGTAALNGDGTVTYTPNEDYYGPDSFTYTISDGELSATASVSITVNSVNDLPTAAFVFSPTAPTTLDTVSFTDGSSDPDGTIVSWAWDFGDGKVSSDQHPNHLFISPGTYNVTLTVTDNEGGTDSYSSTIVVTPGYNTPPGDNVSVDLGSGVTITFTQVLGGGDTELVTSSTPPHGPPDGFKFLGTYYDIVTEATYAGPITITFPYDPAEIPEGRLDHLKVFHADGSGGWQDVTISVDTVNHVIVAQVNSLSWFAIGYLEQKYEWVEFLPPITNTNKTFKRGSTIPIKFRITDMDGNPAPNATAALTIYYLVSGAPEGEPEVISTAAGDLGNLFRYSESEDLYIFNLSTKDPSYLNYFTYRAVVNLEDGTVQSIDFSLKQ